MPRGGARPNSGPKCFNANSQKLRRALVAKVHELSESGEGPVDIAARIMLDDEEPANIRLAACSLMLQHALPKQQSVAVDVRDDRQGMTLEQVTQRIDERMDQLQQLKQRAPALIEGKSTRAD